MTTQEIEKEPSYQLGKAIYIIEMLMGYDEISKRSVHSPSQKRWQKRYAKEQAINFLADHNRISTQKVLE